MTGRITAIKRFAVHDGDGIRTTVFFKGCSLRCLWCHNPETLSPHTQLAFYAHKCVECGACAALCHCHTFQEGAHQIDRAACTQCGRCVEACPQEALALYGQETTVEALLAILLQDRAYYESSGGGVTLSGGECLLQADFCAALLQRLQAAGIHTAVDTCGAVPRAAFDKVIPYTDVFLYDVKAVDEAVHRACTGHSSRQILENLHYLDRSGQAIEVRIPYVPGYNDGEKQNILALLRQLTHVVRVRVLPYHRYAGSKYLALGMPNTLPERLPDDAEIAAFQQEIDKRLASKR